MKLYVCWNARKGPLGHPCGDAYDALLKAGYRPDVIKSYGHFALPDVLNRSEGRRAAKQLTGQSKVPVLVTDDGDAIWDSKQIVEWARQHPAAPEPR